LQHDIAEIIRKTRQRVEDTGEWLQRDGDHLIHGWIHRRERFRLGHDVLLETEALTDPTDHAVADHEVGIRCDDASDDLME
jgi:hypothetical protein